MKETKKVKALIKKLGEIYKKGYLPSREREKYGELHTKLVNCFGHSCFNLSNKELQELDPYAHELSDFFRKFETSGICNIFKEIKKRIAQVGLKIQDSSLSEKLDKNQWRIACFVQDDIFKGNDMHFMIQCGDGKWTSKIGKDSEIEVYDKLPKVYGSKYDRYELYGVYKITNPYIKLDNEKDMEM